MQKKTTTIKRIFKRATKIRITKEGANSQQMLFKMVIKAAVLIIKSVETPKRRRNEQQNRTILDIKFNKLYPIQCQIVNEKAIHSVINTLFVCH